MNRTFCNILTVTLLFLLPLLNAKGQELHTIKIPFSVNQFRIGNQHNILVDSIKEFINMHQQNEVRIYSIDILGEASPEGPTGWNEQLAKLRANALLRQIKSEVKSIEIEPKLTYTTNEQHINNPNVYTYLRATYITYKYYSHSLIECKKLPKHLANSIEIAKELHYENPTKIKTFEQRSPLIAIGTNLLYDILLMPNIQIEYYPRKGIYTIEIQVTLPWFKDKSEHKYFQLQHYSLQANIYPFSHGGLFGWHISPYIEGGVYDLEEQLGWIPFKHKNFEGYQGEFFGTGICIGYAIRPFNKSRIKFDFEMALGYIHTRYKKYIAIGELYPFQQHIKSNMFIPTRVGISIKFNAVTRD